MLVAILFKSGTHHAKKIFKNISPFLNSLERKEDAH